MPTTWRQRSSTEGRGRMDNADRSVWLDIAIRYREGGDRHIYTACGAFFDLCWVEEQLLNALQAVRREMGRE